MEIAALTALFAGTAIVLVYARLRQLGRDPLGPPPSGELPDTALALIAGFLAWVAARALVVEAFIDAEGVAGLSGRTVTILAVMATNVAIALALLRPARKGSFRASLSAGRLVTAGVLCAIVLLSGQLVYGVVMTFAYHLAGAEPPTQELVDETMNATGRDLAVRAVAAIALAPFAEEVFFRGILLPAAARSMGPARGLAVQAFVFGAIHFMTQWTAWPLAIPLAGVGWLAGWIYLRTGSLAVPIVMHAAFNALNFAALTISRTPPAGQ